MQATRSPPPPSPAPSQTSFDSELAALLDEELDGIDTTHIDASAAPLAVATTAGLVQEAPAAGALNDAADQRHATEPDSASEQATTSTMAAHAREHQQQQQHLPGGPSTSAGASAPQQPYKRRRVMGTSNHSAAASATAAKAVASTAAAAAAVEQQVCSPHPGYMCGLCIRCGAAKPEAEDAATDGAAASTTGTVTIKHLHARQALEVTPEEAARISSSTLSSLLAAKRLVLVLDLDHTLLNSARVTEIREAEKLLLERMLEAQSKAAEGQRPLLYHLADKGLWTKLRPLVFEFLEALHELYELHIYTMGDKMYAAEIAKLLDPQRRLFAGRVVSSADSTSRQVKDLDVLLSSEKHALILDDTEQVWASHAANLLHIDRYHFFAASARLWHPGASSPLEAGKDEEPETGQLSVYLRVLRQIHERFFDDVAAAGVPVEQRDVRLCVRDVRVHCLRGVRIVFSRCWPQHLPAYQQPLWQLAETLGADCSTVYNAARTTHIVATHPGTDKVASALKDGKVVVHPDWLLACKSGWRCADTAPYLIRPGQQYQGASKEATAEAWAAAAGWNGTGGSSRRQGGAEADLQAALRGAGGGGTT